MADSDAAKAHRYEPSHKRHRRAASAASTLDKPSTDAALNTLRPLPKFDERFDPPKSASLLAPREQPLVINYQGTKDFWESFRLAKKAQPPLLHNRPTKKPESTFRHDDSLISAAFHHDMPKSSPHWHHLQPSMQPLGLSNVQKLYEQDPVHLQQPTGDELFNEITPAPQSNRSTNLSRGPPPIVTDVPKTVTAFEHAMHPFLNLESADDEEGLALPPAPPSQLSDSATCSSFFLLSQDDGILRLDSNKSDSSEPRNTAPIKRRSEFASRIRHIALQTALVQCTMLQNTVQQLERRPWEVTATHTARWHYEKMCALACTARQLSQALESRGLQARSEYWAGRGCGGMRDYQAGEAHFRDAILLQKLNENDTSGTSRPKGLLPTELEDIDFLLESCRARLEDQEKRSHKIIKIAQQESAKNTKSLQNCLDETSMVSPPWMPDRDRIMELARRQFGHIKLPSKISQSFVDQEHAQTLKAEVQEQMVTDGDNLKIITTKRLSEQEYEYIKHGERRQAEQPLPLTTKLLDRREIKLPSIDTRLIRTQPHIGNATHASALAEFNMQDIKAVDVVATKPPPLDVSSPPVRHIPSFGTLNSRMDPVFEYKDDTQFESDSEESEEGVRENEAIQVEKDAQPKSAPIEQPRLTLTQLEISQASRSKLPQSMPTTPLRSRPDTNWISASTVQELRDAIEKSSSRAADGYLGSTHSPMESGRSFHSPISRGIMM
jgi:hypothetical protein